MATFDVTNLSLNETTILHLEHPVTGEYLYADEEQTQPVTIEVYGRTSKVFKNYINASQRKNLNPSNAKKVKNTDQQDEDNAEFWTVLTKKVSNLSIGDQVVDGPDEIKAMYLDPSLSWINDQVANVLGNTEAFLQK